jgi:glycosyltransferase involved in cell wall biosynthesis/Flp pilus assembly protein TadD
MNAALPRVSVVIPCYNYARYLPEAIESVLAQRVPAELIEIIVVDDDSPDDTAAVAAGYVERLPDRVRYLHQPNAGVGAARNRGIASSRGEFFICLDADDRLHPEYVGKALAIADAEGADIVYPQLQLFGAEEGVWRMAPWDPQELYRRNIVPTAALVRRVVWETTGGFKDVMRQGYEDWEFWITAAEAGFRGRHLPEPLIFYRRHGPSYLDSVFKHADAMRAMIVRLHPKAAPFLADGPFYLGQARVRLYAGHYDQAAYAAARAVKAGEPEGYALLGAALLHLNRVEEALRFLEAGAALPNPSAETRAMLAMGRELAARLRERGPAAEPASPASPAAPAPSASPAAPAPSASPAPPAAPGASPPRSPAAAPRTPRTAPHRPSPRISLCVIARNEAANLVRCLESARPYVDELVVIDTGSTDETVAIARAHGAIVGHFTWCDDFAAARNAALDLASGDWFLKLDADEVLDPATAAQLRDLVQQPGAPGRPRCYAFLIRHHHAGGDHGGGEAAVIEQYEGRLAPRLPGVRFVGRIHEVIRHTGDPSRLEYVYTDRVRIDHYGHQAGAVRDRKKVERNLRLLEAAAAEEPDEPYFLYKLAQHQLEAGNPRAALEAARRALDRSDRLGKNNLADCYRVAIAAQLSLDDPGAIAAAVALGRDGVARCPEHAPLWYQAGLARLAAGDARGAAAAFRRARALKGKPVYGTADPSAAGWRALHGLGMAAQLEGDHEAALRYFEQALRESPGNATVIGAAAEAEQALGRIQEAYDRLDAAVRAAPAHADLRLALGRLLVGTGEPAAATAALDVLQPLLDAEPVPVETYQLLADAFEQLGRSEDAANARLLAVADGVWIAAR